MSAPEAPEKKRGCFFYGCIVSLVLMLVLVIGGFLAVRYAANRFNAIITEYTDTAPMPLPQANMPADEYNALKARASAFQAALNAHSNTPPLILTSRDLNALLANSQEAKEFKDKIYVELAGDQVKGQISFPLDKIHIPMIKTKGRYLNGAGTFNVAITNGVLSVMPKTIEVKGKPLPEQFMAGFRNQNIAEQANQDPQKSAAIQQFESLEVKNGTLTIKPKGN